MTCASPGDRDLRPRVLFVDDETDIVEAFSMAVHLMGIEAVGCTSPGQALKRFAEDPRGFQAVITDFTLPQMTCGEFIAALREIRRDIPIHICTGNAEHEVQEATAGMGVRSVLFKPFDYEGLECFMTALMGRKA